MIEIQRGPLTITLELGTPGWLLIFLVIFLVIGLVWLVLAGIDRIVTVQQRCDELETAANEAAARAAADAAKAPEAFPRLVAAALERELLADHCRLGIESIYSGFKLTMPRTKGQVVVRVERNVAGQDGWRTIVLVATESVGVVRLSDEATRVLDAWMAMRGLSGR